uniref:Uncharacterized protein n=1 Tax=Macrostomum lignano TaxID=282301 RepID=A0A1I8J6I6_9PLAT
MLHLQALMSKSKSHLSLQTHPRTCAEHSTLKASS